MLKNRFLKRRASGEYAQKDGMVVSINATRGVFFTRYGVKIEKRMCGACINLGAMSGTKGQVMSLLTLIGDANIGLKTRGVEKLVEEISVRIGDRSREK
ncbi:MAG: hypothetical protein WC427_03580 [Candidatus Paceibacterota bacterium]|jgi:hypothetical protein